MQGEPEHHPAGAADRVFVIDQEQPHDSLMLRTRVENRCPSNLLREVAAERNRPRPGPALRGARPLPPGDRVLYKGEVLQPLKGGDPVSHCLTPRSLGARAWILATVEVHAA